MELKKKSFILHVDSLGVLSDLSDEQAGKLFKAMLAFHKGKELDLDPLTKMAFSFFKNQFIRDNEKYIKTCEARAQAGSKGGKQKQQNIANASKCYQKQAKVAENDSDNEKDSDKDSDSKKVKEPNKRFAPPSIEEVFEHLSDSGYPYKIEAEKFWNYYESNGWKVGKNKMKNWKSAATGWIKRTNLPKKQVPQSNIPPANYDPLESLRNM